jgi:hypothetical protein
MAQSSAPQSVGLVNSAAPYANPETLVPSRRVEPVPLESGAANEIVACGTAKLAPLLQHTYGGSMLD